MFGFVRYSVFHTVDRGSVLHIVPSGTESQYHHYVDVSKTSVGFYRESKLWVRAVEDILQRHPKITTILFHKDFVATKTDYHQTLIHCIAFAALSCRDSIQVMHEGSRRKLPWVERVLLEAAVCMEVRMISMLPANVATPSALVSYVQDTFKDWKGVICKIWDCNALKKDGFGLVLSVGESNMNHKPAMVTIVRERKGGRCICITGKGVTFDSGGLAVKPFAYMKDQKFDKLGAIYAIGALKLILSDPLFENDTVHCILPFAENAISSVATRPGDVVKSYSGKTVEITNPDAEGRLLLADALSYASKKVKPDVVVDVATLTGHAARIACWHHGYYYATIPEWREAIEKRSFALGERMIPMPYWAPEDEAILKTPVADLTNSPEDCADSLAATMFLKQFVSPKCDWLHIDLAHSVKHMIPTTKGVRTLVEALRVWRGLARNGKN